VVARSATALNLSTERRANAIHRKFGRGNDPFIPQTRHPKALFEQSGVPLTILSLLLGSFMHRPVDFNDQSPVETYEVDNEISKRNLPAKLCAIAPSISNSAPDDRLGLHGVDALLAGETAEDGTGDIGHASIFTRSK
jgi:hypothetical protein